MRGNPFSPSKGSRLNTSWTWNSFERNACLEDDFGLMNICYKNYEDVEDLHDHIPGFSDLMEAQGWEVAMMFNSGIEGNTSSNLGVPSHYVQGELRILQGESPYKTFISN